MPITVDSIQLLDLEQTKACDNRMHHSLHLYVQI